MTDTLCDSQSRSIYYALKLNAFININSITDIITDQILVRVL